MHRYSVAELDTDKSHPGTYRIGIFLIARIGSRWRVDTGDTALEMEFATLGGAVAWCRQQPEKTPPNGVAPRTP
jgi:hypothetical protein